MNYKFNEKCVFEKDDNLQHKVHAKHQERLLPRHCRTDSQMKEPLVQEICFLP